MPAVRSHDSGKSFSVGPTYQAKGPASHAAANGHLHEPGGTAGTDEHGPAGPEDAPEGPIDTPQHLDHGAAPVGDHGLRHRSQHFGMDLSGTGKKEMPEVHSPFA
jgi:hypothetical protein